MNSVGGLLNKPSKAVVSNLGSPDVLGLKLPEAFSTSSAGQDFWELQSKNIWELKVENHRSRGSFTGLRFSHTYEREEGVCLPVLLVCLYELRSDVERCAHRCMYVKNAIHTLAG